MSAILLLISLFALAFLTFAPASSTISIAGKESQFNVNVSYAYAGKYVGNNASYLTKDNTMSQVTQYPTAIILNITRIAGQQIKSCDAVIEVYGIHIMTNTGLKENHAYFIGTNYSSVLSFKTDLPPLINCVDGLIDKSIYSTTVGQLNFNWTDNTSMLSRRIGSIGAYWNSNSSLGLWTEGIPSQISVNVERIGYVTLSHGSTTLYEDAAVNSNDFVHLSTYQDGLIYNNLLPANKLSPGNLLSPTAKDVLVP